MKKRLFKVVLPFVFAVVMLFAACSSLVTGYNYARYDESYETYVSVFRNRAERAAANSGFNAAPTPFGNDGASWDRPATSLAPGIPVTPLPTMPTSGVRTFAPDFPARITGVPAYGDPPRNLNSAEISYFMDWAAPHIIRDYSHFNFEMTDNAQRALSLLDTFRGIYEWPGVIRNADGAILNRATTGANPNIANNRGAWRGDTISNNLFHWGFGAIQTFAIELYRATRDPGAREFLIHLMRDIDFHLVPAADYFTGHNRTLEPVDPILWRTNAEWNANVDLWNNNRALRYAMWRAQHPDTDENQFANCPNFYNPPFIVPVNNVLSDDLIELTNEIMDLRPLPHNPNQSGAAQWQLRDMPVFDEYGVQKWDPNASVPTRLTTHIDIPVALRPIYMNMGTPARIWGSNLWWNGSDAHADRRSPYYDDVIWTVKALIDGALLLNCTRQSPDLMWQAEMSFRYVLSGWTSWLGGGILWNETRLTKNSCINGPAMIVATMLYEYYRDKPIGSPLPMPFFDSGRGEHVPSRIPMAVNQSNIAPTPAVASRGVLTPQLRQEKMDFYLGWAEAIWEWSNRYLRDPMDGMYWDSVHPVIHEDPELVAENDPHHTRTDRWKLPYNVGTYLVAMARMANLHSAAGRNERADYFHRMASQSMRSSYHYFIYRDRSFAPNVDFWNVHHTWFNMYLVKGWLYYAQEFNNDRYMLRLRDTMDFAWLFARDYFGFVQQDWSGRNQSVWNMWNKEVLLVSGTLEIYSLLGIFFDPVPQPPRLGWLT